MFSLPERNEKPRKRGMTSVIDWGPDTFGWGGSAEGIRSALECGAAYIDYVKIFAPNLLLIPMPVLQKAIGCYRDFDVSVYAGGIMLEYAWQRNEVDSYLSLLRKAGLNALEVSENCVNLTNDERNTLIERLQREGFEVIYEYGAKNPEVATTLAEIDDLVMDLDRLGVQYLTLEQSELDMLAQHDYKALKELSKRDWFERTFIEADPYAFPRQHATMIKDFGPDVNLANITLGQVLRIEGMRRGIGRAVDYAIFDTP